METHFDPNHGTINSEPENEYVDFNGVKVKAPKEIRAKSRCVTIDHKIQRINGDIEIIPRINGTSIGRVMAGLIP